MNYRDLQTMDCFKFKEDDPVCYWYYGNGWYGRPYSGGPWYRDREDNPPVILLSRAPTVEAELCAS